MFGGFSNTDNNKILFQLVHTSVKTTQQSDLQDVLRLAHFPLKANYVQATFSICTSFILQD